MRQHVENHKRAAATYPPLPHLDGTEGEYTEGWDTWTLPDDTVAPANAPYGTNELLLKSRAPLLTAEECDFLIGMAEAHAVEQGWDTRYPVQGYTHEVNVANCPEGVEVLRRALFTRLFPAAAAQFPHAIRNASSLRVYDALVVKYDAASGNNCLPVHQDFGLLTYNIALSDDESYTDGGTWFQFCGETLRTRRGEGLLHAGRLVHCGVPVARGTRYQLVIFVLSTDHADVAGRLQAVGAATGSKASGALQDLTLSCRTLELSSKYNPLDAETWSQLGHNHLAQSDLPRAERAFARAVALSGGRDFAALCSHARVLDALQRPAESIATWQQAIEVGSPPSPRQHAEAREARHNFGVSLLALGLLEEAGQAFESVVNEEEDAAESWAALGVCMSRLQQPEAALVCQKQVLRIRGV